MTYHEDVMRVMADGEPRTATAITKEIYGEIPRSQWKSKASHVGRTIRMDVKYGFFKEVGTEQIGSNRATVFQLAEVSE